MHLQLSAFLSADDFLSACDRTDFDIALLDIEMKGTNGFDAAKRLSLKDKHPLMIFVTKSTAYTIRGYGIVYRYLTKPLELGTLSEVMDSAVREVTANRFSFVINGISQIVILDEIYYFEVYNHTTVLHTIDKTFFIRKTLKEVLTNLPQGYFGMPHQSFIVNFVHVRTATSTTVKLTNGVRIPVSRRKQKEFIYSLHMYLGR